MFQNIYCPAQCLPDNDWWAGASCFDHTMYVDNSTRLNVGTSHMFLYTLEMQLYKVAMRIKWSDFDRWVVSAPEGIYNVFR